MSLASENETARKTTSRFLDRHSVRPGQKLWAFVRVFECNQPEMEEVVFLGLAPYSGFYFSRKEESPRLKSNTEAHFAETREALIWAEISRLAEERGLIQTKIDKLVSLIEPPARRDLSTDERNAIYDATGGGEPYCEACDRAELS